MHSSRMRTACLLTVSPYLVISHARLPWSNHACPTEQLCTPAQSNYACPPRATTHASPGQPHMPPQKQPCTSPQSNHACPLGATMHAPQSNHAHPPRATTHAPRATTHNLRKLHLQAVKKIKCELTLCEI